MLSTALSGPGKLLLISGQSAAGHVTTLMWLFTINKRERREEGVGEGGKEKLSPTFIACK